ncbi:MAG TPA: hypothetical protein VEL79_18450 [Vicinamibacterales bacterium]|nr:hypothetical protein [Vicinamibacterales bacterium]
MNTQTFVLLLLGVVLAVYVGIALTTWVRLRGTRVVTCPENTQPAAVKLDVGHAAATAVWEEADLKLAGCSRWPERAGCDEACLAQIAASPDETRARTMAVHFFERKSCAICQHEIGPLSAATLQPGFMNPTSHEAIAWDEVPAQDLPDAFATGRAICANCTLAESFRTRFPDRVVERTPRPGSLPN